MENNNNNNITDNNQNHLAPEVETRPTNGSDHATTERDHSKSSSISSNEIKTPSQLEDDTSSSSNVSLQHGVELAELLRHAWPKKLLLIAYSSIILSSLITRFANYSSGTYTPYVTSSFRSHSLMTTAGVMERIASIAAYPIVAKTSDFFGRADGFILAFTIITIGYILFASCTNINGYVAAAIFDGVGDVAYTIMVQIFITDTSSFAYRGLLLSLPEAVTAIPTLYLGSIVAESMLDHSTWRWGYGMWAIILPVVALPLVVLQFVLQRKAVKAGAGKKEIRILRDVREEDSFLKKVFHVLWVELDLPGAILLIAALALILVPLTLTGKAYSYRWGDADFIAMFVVGFVILAAFLVWDAKYARKPFVPYRMVKKWTVIAAMLMGTFDFMSYGVFTSFFPSLLQVSGGFSPGQATRIDNSLRVSFQIASVLAGFIMRYIRKTTVLVYIGAPLCLLGQGMMIYLVNVNGERMGTEVQLIVVKTMYGIGRGFYQTASQVALQSVVSHQDVAVATAVFFSAMTVGGAIGVSVGGAYWNNYLPDRLAEYLPAEAQKDAGKYFKDMKAALKTTGPIREAINLSYRLTMKNLAIMATCFLVPLIFLMLLIKDVRLETTEEELAREAAKRREVEERLAALNIPMRDGPSDEPSDEKTSQPVIAQTPSTSVAEGEKKWWKTFIR